MKFLVYILALIFAILTIVGASLPEMDGLQIDVLREGTGTETVKKGDQLSMHYRGTLASDGSEFDASYNRGTPFNVKIGVGQVIKGWDEGLIGMKVGEKRKLTIAPELGYGSRGIGPIPGGATLIFETECLSINGKGKDEL